MPNYPFEVWPMIDGAGFLVRMIDFPDATPGSGVTIKKALSDAEAKCVRWLLARNRTNFHRHSEATGARTTEPPPWLQPPGSGAWQTPPDVCFVEFTDELLFMAQEDARQRRSSQLPQMRAGRAAGKGNEGTRTFILQLDAHSRRPLKDTELARLAGVSKQYVGTLRAEEQYKNTLKAYRAAKRVDQQSRCFEEPGDRLRRLDEMTAQQLKDEIFRWANQPSNAWPLKSLISGKIYQSATDVVVAVWDSIQQSEMSAGFRQYPRDFLLDDEIWCEE